jgi:hypothetical protein
LPRVAATPDGTFVIIWVTVSGDAGRPERRIRGQVFDSDARPLGTVFSANHSAAYLADDGPSLAVRDDGTFVVAWGQARGANYEVLVQEFAADGIPVGHPVRAGKDGYVMHTVVAVDHAGDFVVAWNDSGDVGTRVVAQRFRRGGSPVGQGFEFGSGDGHDVAPEVAGGSRGVVLGWASDEPARAFLRIFVDGVLGPRTPVGRVSSRPGGGELGLAIAEEAEGTILVARQNIRCDPEAPGCDELVSSILVQTYSADGTPLAEAHRIGGGRRRAVSRPHVTSVGSGAFTVAWTDVDITTGETFDAVQRVDASGKPVGPPVRISPAAQFVDVAGTSHGDFVLVWNPSDEGIERVVGQRYRQLWCKGHAATLGGTVGDDRLSGTDGDDVIVGRGGNDTIEGRGGRDVICGNSGDDLLVGGGQADTMDGGAGDDTIRGNATDSCTDAAGANDISCD